MPAAYLIGTISQPEVALTFDFSDVHATTGEPLGTWVKSLPGRRWDPSGKRWRVQCFGAMPTAALRAAGFVFDPEAQHPERHESLDGVFDLDELVPPLVLAHETRPIAVVRMRFSGWDRTKRFLPLGATWDKATQRFEVRLVDLVTFSPQGERVIWPNLQYMGNTVERAFAQSLVDAPTDSAISTVAATAAMSTGLDLTRQAEEAVASLVAEVGDIPDDFTMALYPYQRLGALAAAAGRGLLADSPGLGKGSPVSEPILTPSGWSTYGDIRPGHLVVGSDGHPTRVKAIYDRGVLPTYRVDVGDADVVVDPEHLWQVVKEATGETLVVETTTLMGLIESGRYRLPLVEPVWFAHRDIDPNLDPAVEGARLGAAAVTDPSVCIDEDILWHPDPAFRTEFLRAFLSAETRRSWFGVVFCLSEQLHEDLRHLVLSLGGTTDTLPSVDDGYGPLVWPIVVNLRGSINCGAEPVRYVESITAYPTGERVVCIEVEADDSLYVANGFTVTHNTRQALAAASLRRSHRTVIVVPPVVVTNWVKETEESSLAKNCHGDIVMFRAGRKERPFPDRGVVVIPDSLMTSRPHLVQQAIDWAPEVFVYDEAHRARNWESKRSEVMRAFSEQLPPDCLRIAISGTPLFSQPHELASILAITGHLDPVFGGYSNFLTEYSKQNHFKAWVAQKKKLPQLRQRLSEHVWVRRLKADVLKDLPPKSRVGVFVDVDLKDYRKAHDEVIDKITDWLVAFWDEKAEEAAKILADPKVSPEVKAKAGPRWPNGEEKDSWARQQIGLMSPLRKAAGVAKVPVALDTINDWVASNRLDTPAADGSLYDRPLLVWAHHQEVIAALKDGIAAANKDVQVAVEIIDGATPAATRGAIVDRFQAGKIGVLIASNTAAGVGITLTRGSDMIFVETDWTPAIVSQCEDRQCRIGQTQPVICKTLIAPETLDQRIQKVLLTKAEVLNEVLGGTEADVAVASTEDDLVAPSEIILALIEVAEPKAVKALKERAKLAA